MDNESPPAAPKQSGLLRFWAELKRRKVMRVAITYAVVAWLIIEVADTTFEGFGIPIWAFRFVVIMMLLGFPIAVIIAWAFELSPDGIKTTKAARIENPNAESDSATQKKRNWFSVLFAAAIPTLIFGTLALIFYFRSGDAGELTSENKSIAVLPLDNQSPDPENASFALGIQDNILTNLSKIKELEVKSRTSTMRYNDPDRNSSKIGQELDAKYLVEGSVWRVEDKVQVTIQLIDSATDNHLWADVFKRDLNDQFAICSEIAKTIAKEIQAVISPEEIEQIERRPTDNLEAYDLYTEGLEYQLKESNEGFKTSIELFEAAIQRDPSFVLAHIAKARSYRQRMTYFEPPIEMLSNVRLAVTEAITLDPNSAEARSALGMAYLQSWHFNNAWRYLSDAKTRDPRIGVTHLGLALYYSCIGDARRALKALADAEARDPLNAEIADWGHFVYLMFQDYIPGIEWANEKVLLFPNSAAVATDASMLFSVTGDHERAVTLAEEGVRLGQRSPYFLVGLSQVYARAGQVDEAREVLAEAEQSQLYMCPYETAVTYILLGDIDSAFEQLNRGVAFRSNCMMFTRYDPRLDSIRNDPRFVKILNAVGLDDVSILGYPR